MRMEFFFPPSTIILYFLPQNLFPWVLNSQKPLLLHTDQKQPPRWGLHLFFLSSVQFLCQHQASGHRTPFLSYYSVAGEHPLTLDCCQVYLLQPGAFLAEVPVSLLMALILPFDLQSTPLALASHAFCHPQLIFWDSPFRESFTEAVFILEVSVSVTPFPTRPPLPLPSSLLELLLYQMVRTARVHTGLSEARDVVLLEPLLVFSHWGQCATQEAGTLGDQPIKSKVSGAT